MIRHEVIFAVKAGPSDAYLDNVLTKIREMTERIDIVQRCVVARNRSRQYRHVMMVVFLADEDALAVYTRHPLHTQITGVINSLAEMMVVADVVVADSGDRQERTA